MLPRTLALIDDDAEYTKGLSQFLRERGVAVDVFNDSRLFLGHTAPYSYDFYIVDMMLAGIAGLDVIKVLRLRSQAGVLVLSNCLLEDLFAQVVDAGGDMYLTKTVQFEHVALTIRAVYRRANQVPLAASPWSFNRRSGQLVAPDGSAVDLSGAEQVIMDCFVDANGADVKRECLLERLGQGGISAEASNSLNATIYRLKRRIERATPLMAPLHCKSRFGYVFRAPIRAL